MIGRKLSSNVRKESIPPTVIFTDTETIERDKGQLDLLLGCYEIWAVSPNGRPMYSKGVGEYATEDEFYTLAKSNAPCRIVAHNWNFDAAVLRIGAADNMLKHGYEIDVDKGIYSLPGKGYAPFLLRLAFEEGDCELICNTNFYKMSLRTIGDSLGMPKTDMPATDDIPAMLEYCRNDVAVLRTAWFAMFEYTHALAGVTPGITAAMASNRVYRAGYYRPNVPAQGTHHIGPVNDAERAAYHGGRTDTFYKGVPYGETVYKYDVNSLYPYCMMGDIPVRYLQTGSSEWVAGFDGYAVLSQVTLNIPPESQYGFLGLEGIIMDGRLVFPVGRYTAWVWQPLLEIADECGYIETVHNVLVYECDNLFDAYITDLYAKRQEYKASGNDAFQTLTKLMMNSLYGKFGQRANGGWQQVSPDSLEYKVMDGLGVRFSQEFDDAERDYWRNGDKLYRYNDGEGLSLNSVCSIAGYITAKGRAILWRAMASLLDSGATLYMCDTDSVVCNMPMDDAFVDPTELGKFKVEGISSGDVCRFDAPKDYTYNSKRKLKGIRTPIDGPVHPQDVFPNFMTDLMSANPNRRQRLETGAVISRIAKRPSGINHKRRELGEGLPTLPLVV